MLYESDESWTAASVEEVGADGGNRCGTDVITGRRVVKAVAIGASCVLIGRPILYALTLAGEADVGQLLHIRHARHGKGWR